MPEHEGRQRIHQEQNDGQHHHVLRMIVLFEGKLRREARNAGVSSHTNPTNLRYETVEELGMLEKMQLLKNLVYRIDMLADCSGVTLRL